MEGHGRSKEETLAVMPPGRLTGNMAVNAELTSLIARLRLTADRAAAVTSSNSMLRWRCNGGEIVQGKIVASAAVSRLARPACLPIQEVRLHAALSRLLLLLTLS